MPNHNQSRPYGRMSFVEGRNEAAIRIHQEEFRAHTLLHTSPASVVMVPGRGLRHGTRPANLVMTPGL